MTFHPHKLCDTMALVYEFILDNVTLLSKRTRKRFKLEKTVTHSVSYPSYFLFPHNLSATWMWWNANHMVVVAPTFLNRHAHLVIHWIWDLNWWEEISLHSNCVLYLRNCISHSMKPCTTNSSHGWLLIWRSLVCMCTTVFRTGDDDEDIIDALVAVANCLRCRC